MEQATHHLRSNPLSCARLLTIIQGTRQYCPPLTQTSLKPSTKFFSTVLIEPDDHKLMAMIRQTTKCDGKARLRSSLASASPIACSIASDGIAASSALSTVPDSMIGDIRENSLSCLFAAIAPWGQRSVYLVLVLTEPYCERTDCLGANRRV